MIKQVLAAAILLAGVTATTASAQRSVQRIGNNAMLGEVRAFGTNFCPRGWAETHGQMLPISGNEALFSLLGTQFGGDGRTTFALPDLRGRVIIGEGNGPGRDRAARRRNRCVGGYGCYDDRNARHDRVYRDRGTFPVPELRVKYPRWSG